MLKTIKSKIALVAVAGLGFGLLSTVPAFAAAGTASAVTGYVGRISLNADDAGGADADYVLAVATVAGLTNTAKDDTIALELTDGPAGGSFTITSIASGAGADDTATYAADNTVAVGGGAAIFKEGDQAGAGAAGDAATNKWGTTSATLTIRGTASIAGVYTLKVGTTTTASATVTIGGAPTSVTITAAPKSNPAIAKNLVVVPKDAAGNSTLLSGTERLLFTSNAAAAVTFDALSNGLAVPTGVAAGANGVVAQAAVDGKITMPVAASAGGTYTLTVSASAGLITNGVPAFAPQTSSYVVNTATTAAPNKISLTNTTNIKLNGTGAWTNANGTKYLGSTLLSSLAIKVEGLTANTAATLIVEHSAGALTAPLTTDTIIVEADANGVATTNVALTGVEAADAVQIGIDGDDGGATLDDAAGTDRKDLVLEVVFEAATFAGDLATTAGGTTFSPGFANDGAGNAVVTVPVKAGEALTLTATAKDQFGNVGIGALVAATNGTVTVQRVTDASGVATLSLAAPTDATVTSAAWTVTLTPPGGAAVALVAADTSGVITINYTTTGGVASFTMSARNVDNTAVDVSAATAAAGLRVPSDGTITKDGATPEVVEIVTSAKITASGANAAGLPLTATVTGGLLYKADPNAVTIYSTLTPGKATLETVTAAGDAAFHLVPTAKSGTLTVTVGGVTQTLNFVAHIPVAGARNVKWAAATANGAGGAYVPLTATATDTFGNAVPGAVIDFALTGIGRFANGARTLQLATDSSGQAVVEVTAGTAESGTSTVTATGNPTANTNASPQFDDAVSVPVAGFTAASGAVSATVTWTAGSAAANAETTAIKNDVKAVSDTVATLSKAVTTVQSSVTELTTSFTSQIKSLTSAIAKISRAIAAIQKSLKARR